MDINLVPGLYESLDVPYLVRPTQDGLRLYAMRLTVTAKGIQREYDKGAVSLPTTGRSHDQRARSCLNAYLWPLFGLQSETKRPHLRRARHGSGLR
jgi:hypothetical protein